MSNTDKHPGTVYPTFNPDVVSLSQCRLTSKQGSYERGKKYSGKENELVASRPHRPCLLTIYISTLWSCEHRKHCLSKVPKDTIVWIYRWTYVYTKNCPFTGWEIIKLRVCVQLQFIYEVDICKVVESDVIFKQLREIRHMWGKIAKRFYIYMMTKETQCHTHWYMLFGFISLHSSRNLNRNNTNWFFLTKLLSHSQIH